MDQGATPNEQAGRSGARLLALAALAGGAILVLLVMLGTFSSTYVVEARFANSSALVPGNAVKVAGSDVGKVTSVSLSEEGDARIELELDDEIAPLREGTRALIRQLGPAGLANRYVALTLGPPDSPEIPSGGELPREQTTSAVNLDAVLSSFTPERRRSLQRLFKRSGDIYAGSGARSFNQMLTKLSPAFAELGGMSRELVRDRKALAGLIDRGAVASQAIASRREDLTSALANTATTMSALASRRTELADSLRRAPAVFDQTTGVLANAGEAVRELRPALRDIPPAGEPLQGALSRANRIFPPLTDVAERLRVLQPDAQKSLGQLRLLGHVAPRGLGAAGFALRDAQPITRVLRYYGSDLLIGVFQGLLSVAAASHDRWGHYIKLEYTQPYQTLVGSPFLDQPLPPLASNLFGLRSRLLRRCPGGNVPPAPDLSNPWVLDSSICDPSHNAPASYNEPPPATPAPSSGGSP